MILWSCCGLAKFVFGRCSNEVHGVVWWGEVCGECYITQWARGERVECICSIEFVGTNAGGEEKGREGKGREGKGRKGKRWEGREGMEENGRGY